MKNAVLTLLALSALSTAAAAQAEYVWVTNRGSDNVTVYDNAVPTLPRVVIPLNAAPAQGSPYGIVGVPSRRRVYVSFSETGTRLARVAVFDSESFQLINVVPIPVADEARRMTLSRDGSIIFLACRNGTNGAVFALGIGSNQDNPPVSFVSQVAGSVGPAEDVTEVPGAVVQFGTGTAPGKIYYTVPSGAGVIGIHNFVGGFSSSIPVGPLNASLPFGLDRAPDDTFVLVGVNETAVSQYKILQVDSFNDAVTPRTLAITTMSRTWDVAFRGVAGAPPFRAYVLAQESAYNIFEADADLASFNFNFASRSGALEPPPLRSVAHLKGPSMDRLFMGNDLAGPTDTVFSVSPDPITGAGAGWNPLSGGAALPPPQLGPTEFAFMPAPPRPLAADACPKGAANVVGNQVTVTGKNFLPGTVVQIPGGAAPVTIPTTVVDSSTLRATINTPMFPDENDLIVRSLDGQIYTLQSFYAACSPATTAFPMTLPSLFQGYGLRSAPAYYTKADLRLALAAALGPYNPSVYRVFLYRGGRYVELSELDDEDCDLCGGAFWILTRWGGAATLNALDALSNHAVASMRVLPLRPGWNMISLPFQNGGPTDTKDWTTVNVTPDGEAWTGPVLTGAVGSPLSSLFDYVNGSYQIVTTMVAGQGYFVKNNSPVLQYLLVNTTITKPTATASSVSYAPVPPGVETPPPPPGGLGSDRSSSGSCGLFGTEFLLLFLGSRAFHLLRRRRRLAS